MQFFLCQYDEKIRFKMWSKFTQFGSRKAKSFRTEGVAFRIFFKISYGLDILSSCIKVPKQVTCSLFVLLYKLFICVYKRMWFDPFPDPTPYMCGELSLLGK